MASATPIFSRRTLIWILSVSGIAFAGMLFLMIYSEDVTGGSAAGPHPYSDSAIGHRAFVSFLEEIDVPVVVSRNRSLFDRVRGNGMQILLEPPSDTDFEDMMLGLLGGGPVLLVLPKWRGTIDPEKPRWVREVAAIEPDHVRDILELVVKRGEVVRPGAPVSWTSSVFESDPAMSLPQLINAPGLTALVESDEGVLLGMYEALGAEIYILSDPDVLNNHGLGEGDNAAFMMELVNFLRGSDGPVFIDATLHGFTRSANLWRTVFELPLLPITLLGLAVVIAVFWSGSVRFGAPRPAPKELLPGKQGLIDNTARLLDFGGNFQVILRDYLEASSRRVATALNAPRGLDKVDLGPWFDRIAESRGLDVRFAYLTTDINALVSLPNTELRRLFKAARDVHQWKREMLRGPRTD